MTTVKSTVRTEHSLPWQRLVPYFLGIADALALFAAFYFARISHALYYSIDPLQVLLHWWGEIVQVNILLFFLLAATAILAFAYKGHYARRKAFWDEMGEMVGVLTVLVVLNASLAFVGKWPMSRLWLFSTWGLAFLFLPASRLVMRRILYHLNAWNRPVVIVGCGQNAAEAIRALDSEPLLGYEVQRVLVPEGATPPGDGFPARAPIQTLDNNPLETLARLGDPHVILALDMDQWEAQERLIRTLSFSYRNLTIAPPLRGLPLFGLETMHFFSHEVLMLRVRDNLARPASQWMKQFFDLLATSLIVLMLAVPMLVIVLRIRREDGGPAFFAQERIGKDGKPFPCLKFRSMVVDAEQKLNIYLDEHPEARAEYERNYKLRNDPRVTSIGRFLRRTSLDELPQIFNVLRGEMSLVGPRPLLEKERSRYGEGIHLYTQVRPGITGLWQISGRSNTTFAERVHLDAWYVKNWSLWYDIVILLRTVKVVFRREGAY